MRVAVATKRPSCGHLVFFQLNTNMKADHVENADGTVSVSMKFSAAEFEDFVRVLSSREFEAASSAFGGNDYCCRCANGMAHTVHAGNSLFAFAKCLSACGRPGFQMTSGKC